jgi:hypothetical protein
MMSMSDSTASGTPNAGMRRSNAKPTMRWIASFSGNSDQNESPCRSPTVASKYVLSPVAGPGAIRSMRRAPGANVLFQLHRSEGVAEPLGDGPAE